MSGRLIGEFQIIGLSIEDMLSFSNTDGSISLCGLKTSISG